MQQIEINESDFPSKERIWDKLYQCRDFELSNFWQKSVFLFGFISLCFCGYGALLLKTADICVKNDYLHEYMFGVSILGIMLSYVWIAMCKGSKAWYEVYEKVIYGIEYELFTKRGASKYIEGDFLKEFKDEIDDNLFLNYKGGPFSPSKVNILIGNILLIIWIICALICVGNLLQCMPFGRNMVTPLLILFGLVIAFIFPFWLKKSVRSRILANRVHNLSKDAQNIINDKLDEILIDNNANIDDEKTSKVFSSYKQYITDEIQRKFKKEATAFFEREFENAFEDQLQQKISSITKQQISDFVKQITKETQGD